MTAEIAVTDAHALIWYARGDRRRIGPCARKLFLAAEAGRSSIYVPTMALVEISEAASRGTVQLRDGFTAWTEALLASGRFLAIDLTTEIVLRAERLHSIPERGDRLIAATAVHLDCPLYHPRPRNPGGGRGGDLVDVATSAKPPRRRAGRR